MMYECRRQTIMINDDIKVSKAKKKEGGCGVCVCVVYQKVRDQSGWN